MEGRAFHRVKDLAWAIVVLICRTKGTCQSQEQRGRWEAAERGGNAIPETFWNNIQFGLKTRARVID